MTTDLKSAVDALTRPTTTKVPVGDRWETVTHEPLLTQLQEAVRSSFGGSSTGGSSTTGGVLNSDAFARSVEILSQLGDWCRAVGVRPARPRDAVADLVAWSIVFHGRPEGPTVVLERWASDIRDLLDPPKRVPLGDPCAACGATVFTDTDGAVSLPVVVEYDGSLVNLDRRAAEATMRARCRVCFVEWVGAGAITELMEELGQ